MASTLFGVFAKTRFYAVVAALCLWALLGALIRLRGLEDRSRALRALGIAAALSLSFGAVGVVWERPAWIFEISLVALMGAFPLHFWLPNLVPYSPFLGATLAPILLGRFAAIACLNLCPVEPNAAFAVLGLAGALWCGCASFATDNLREKLGYFASAHGSLCLWAIGKGAPELAVLLMLVTLPGIVLWGLAASILYDRLKYLDLDRLRGLGAQLPRMNLLYIGAALGVAFFPGTSAFPGLVFLIERAPRGGWEVWGIGAAFLLLFLSAGATYVRMAFGETAEDVRRTGDLNVRELAAVIPLGLCVAAGLAPGLVDVQRSLIE